MNKQDLHNELLALEHTIYIAQNCNEKLKDLVKCNSRQYEDCIHNEIAIKRAIKAFEILRNNL